MTESELSAASAASVTAERRLATDRRRLDRGGRRTGDPEGLPGGGSIGKVGMWIFLATDAMGFGGLLLAYAILRTRAPGWPDPAIRHDRPLAGALTFVLLVSGATMTGALAAARARNRRLARTLLFLTILCGAVFLAGQVAEFHDLAVTRHLGLTSDMGAAFFFVITGYHGLHVLVGLLVLAALGLGRGPVPAADSAAGDAAAPDADGVARAIRAWDVASLYWQFVDAIWVVIFTALYLLPPVVGG